MLSPVRFGSQAQFSKPQKSEATSVSFGAEEVSIRNTKNDKGEPIPVLNNCMVKLHPETITALQQMLTNVKKA